uniref:Fibroin-3 n=1 Tax=Tolypocladium ophioglossoides (strain CBS 100239) TaxID=1163406 RepID=A0A0L0NMR2_TOLOC
MPPVDVAMVRSLRGGVLEQFKDVLARSIAAGMARRDLISDAQGKVTDVKTAFSSWDNCMKAAFCKWPVIAVIVVGGLILLGIIWCIIRCACCARSCCCSCFQCLKCCGNCCGCCDPPGGRRHKYLDEPYIPPHHGYQQQAPMRAPSAAAAAPKQPVFEPPQYAEFDVSKKGGEDALPHMPSWEGAGSKKVMLEEEEVEMNHLKKSPTPNPGQAPLATPSTGPANAMGMEPHSPYGPPSTNPNGYMPNQSQQALGQDRLSPGQSQQNLGAYASRDQPGYYNYNVNRESNGFGLDQPYDDPTAMASAHGQHPPSQSYMNNGQSQPYAPPAIAEIGQGRRSPAPGRNGYGQSRHMNQGYAEMPIEMPAEPVQAGHYDQQSPQGMRRQGTGENIPEGYGMRRRGTGDGVVTVGNRLPDGMDPRMRNSPGPRRTPGPRGDNPFGQSPRASPAPREPGYGQPGYVPPRDHVNGTYSPAPERHFSPAPERQNSPAPGPQRSPEHRPPPLTRPPQNPAAFAQSPPRSPITNNSGFDFTSGYARPTNDHRRPSESKQSPTKEAYPGYKPYQPAQEGWSGV